MITQFKPNIIQIQTQHPANQTQHPANQTQHPANQTQHPSNQTQHPPSQIHDHTIQTHDQPHQPHQIQVQPQSTQIKVNRVVPPPRASTEAPIVKTSTVNVWGVIDPFVLTFNHVNHSIELDVKPIEIVMWFMDKVRIFVNLIINVIV